MWRRYSLIYLGREIFSQFRRNCGGIIWRGLIVTNIGRVYTKCIKLKWWDGKVHHEGIQCSFLSLCVDRIQYKLILTFWFYYMRRSNSTTKAMVSNPITVNKVKQSIRCCDWNEQYFFVVPRGMNNIVNSLLSSAFCRNVVRFFLPFVNTALPSRPVWWDE